MTSYQIIGMLGLLLGVAACFVMFKEHFKTLNKKNLTKYGLFFLGTAIIIGTSLFKVVSTLSELGMPGLNVLEAEGGSGLLITMLLPIIFMFLLIIFMRKANQEAEMKVKGMGSDRMPITHLLIWAVRIYVAVLFIFSGFVKANDYIGFSYKLEEYFQVFANYLPALEGFWGFWEGLALPLAWFISVFEIALAVAILVGWRMRLTALLTLLMMIFFTFLTAFSAITGEVTDCGCFGDALKLEPWESFTKDLVYMVMLIPVYLLRKEIKPFPNNKIATALTVAAFIISGAYAWYSHENLPQVDYRAYKVGIDLNVCTTQEDEKGEIKCKDWYQNYYFDFRAAEQAAQDTNFVMPAEVDPLKGKVLAVFMAKIQKADAEAVKGSIELASKLQPAGIQVVGLSAAYRSLLQEKDDEFKFNYPISLWDAKMLKTVVRSNPGYVLMQDGLILGKWHHNNAPSKTEIEGLLK